MDQKKALEIMEEVYAAYEKVLPCPIHDAYLYGDYATGNYHEDSSVNIVLALDMSRENLNKLRADLCSIDSRLGMKYDVMIFTYLAPLSSFAKKYTCYLYGDVWNDGIRYGASDEEITAVRERARLRKENAMKPEKALEILGEVYTAYAKILPCPIHDAFLYGSYARGDYDEESDVDIFITVDMAREELHPYEDAMSTVRSALGLKYDILVSVVVTPLDQFQRYSEALPYYRNILSEGIRYAA